MCSASLGQLSRGKASEQETRLQALAAHRPVHPAPAQHLAENGQSEQSWETGDGGWLGAWGEMEIWPES